MKVKVFDEESEKDLEISINGFINNTNYDIIDWKWEQINDFKEVF